MRKTLSEADERHIKITICKKKKKNTLAECLEFRQAQDGKRDGIDGRVVKEGQ
jgi:hypothetical protein